VAAPILGVRTLRQLEDNLGALQVVLSQADMAQLDRASRIELGFPHDLLNYDFIRHGLFAGTHVKLRGV
jgi:diketogulonate reductase-like aldo/keto reductase